MAAVFELSVCAGLIPAIFLSAISVTRRISPEAMDVHTKEQIKKFWLLPLIVVLAGFALMQVNIPALALQVVHVPQADVRTVLWNQRHMDLLGQIASCWPARWASGADEGVRSVSSQEMLPVLRLGRRRSSWSSASTASW